MTIRRIIFSRKGLDNGAGRAASPIVAGRPVSLPIPTGRYPGGRPYGELAGERAELAGWVSGGRLGREAMCHLDPDIDPASLADRPAGWRGAFGQVGAAQSHLRNQGVGIGDLFLFFGLFRPAEREAAGWRWTGAARHALFGWLEIGSVLTGAGLRERANRESWLRGHPHAAAGWGANNCLYVAADRLKGAGDLPGSGVFSTAVPLTAEGGACSLWQVPAWLERTRMSYRRHDRFWPAPGRMDARGQWQEGAALADEDALGWAHGLIVENAA